MRIAPVVLLACLAVSVCFSQSSSSSLPSRSNSSPSKWQVGQVMAAKVHRPAEGEDSRITRYDVTVHVGSMEYVILYTPPDGIDVVEYKLGRDGLVLVGADTVKWNDLLGRPHQAPILARRAIPPKTQR